MSRPSSLRAFTLLELLTTVAGLVIVLALMVSIARDVRNRSAERVTDDLLRALDLAMGEYRQAYGALPSVTPIVQDDVTEPTVQARAEHNGRDVAAALARFKAQTGAALEGVPLGGASARPPEQGFRDAWGGPIVFMPTQHPLIGMAAGDRHFFVSAGPDGRFLTRQDNIASYEGAPLAP